MEGPGSEMQNAVACSPQLLQFLLVLVLLHLYYGHLVCLGKQKFRASDIT